MITLNCDRIEPAAQKKRQRTPDRRSNYRKLQEEEHFSSNVSFALYFRVPLLINFSVSCAFFRHEQRVSLRLPLSVLSDVMERLSLTPVYGKRQTPAKIKLLPSVLCLHLSVQ